MQQACQPVFSTSNTRGSARDRFLAQLVDLVPAFGFCPNGPFDGGEPEFPDSGWGFVSCPALDCSMRYDPFVGSLLLQITEKIGKTSAYPRAYGYIFFADRHVFYSRQFLKAACELMCQSAHFHALLHQPAVLPPLLGMNPVFKIRLSQCAKCKGSGREKSRLV